MYPHNVHNITLNMFGHAAHNHGNNPQNGRVRINADMLDLGAQDGVPRPVRTTTNKNTWTDIFGNGELQIKILRKGRRNTRPQTSDLCHIRYVGRLEDGKVVEKFDSLKIHIGDHEVVQGLELALPLMNVGEKSIVIVGARFAYGALGNPPHVPPNATIKYVIELLMSEMETPVENLPHEDRMTMAISKRARGNWWYARQDYSKAVQCYKKAVDLLDETLPYASPTGEVIENSPENLRIVVRDRIKAYNNLAAAQLVLKAYESAMASVVEVLKQQPNNVKALFRKSKILAATGHLNDAVECLLHASKVEPKNTAVISELKKCLRTIEVEKQEEKNLYRKMFGQPVQTMEPEVEQMTQLQERTNWKKLVGPVATAAVMAAIAFALSYKFKNYPFM